MKHAEYVVPFSSESFAFSLLSKTLKVKIYYLHLYGCDETFSITLRKENGLKVLVKKVLRRISEQEVEGNCIMESLIICNLH
jgi:hypothetical protein